MNNTIERQRDIIGLMQYLDISPTMYKNAVEKYHALARHLEDSGIDADIYPQGSFALGTVVRPSANDQNANYDLDFICQVRGEKDSTSPRNLRQKVLKALIASAIYSDRLTFDDNCFTITYADIGNVGFSIDIVPAVDEDEVNKNRLKRECDRPDLVNTTIAIPHCTQEKNYIWNTSNPKGFRTWFTEINYPFASYKRYERRQSLFSANQSIFASVEEVPEDLERSALQRVIQILKYHRDVYFSNLKRSDSAKLKPGSFIITTLVAEISNSAAQDLEVFELLEYVLNELSIYSNRLKLSNYEFIRTYGERSLISKNNGKWCVPNPLNPRENLAESWNINNDIPKYFFFWINACIHDLISSMSMSDSEFRTNMENAFGSSFIQQEWANKYKTSVYMDPKPITTTAKPYRA